MKRLYVAAGFLFTALGTVGAFLPVLPTVPFLLLASFCFAKGSERYHRWFVGTKLYKNHLESFASSRSMTLKTKLSILLPVSAMLILLMVWIDSLPMRICLGAILLVKYYYFIFRIHTVRRRPQREPGGEPQQIMNGGHADG